MEARESAGNNRKEEVHLATAPFFGFGIY